MENSLPKMVQKAPFKVAVEAGKKYSFCTCGLSATQPFCDGNHKGTGFKSIKFEADESKVINFCGCKVSNNGMLCDGSHNKI